MHACFLDENVQILQSTPEEILSKYTKLTTGTKKKTENLGDQDDSASRYSARKNHLAVYIL
jgi:hypothetical protein